MTGERGKHMQSVSCGAAGSHDVVTDWGLVATTCEFLAFSFRYPDRGAVMPIASGEWADALDELRRAWGFAADAECGELTRADSGEGPEAVLHALRQEATRLFVGPPTPAASPYESVWAAARTHAAPLLFVSPSAIAVERFCAACGLGRPQGTNESLDHVSSELELLQFLASVESGAVDAASCGVALADLPGGSPATAFELFFDEHPAMWMCDFACEVERISSRVFYRAAARLLRDFVSAR
ncbi:molecular chaperone TorD [Slackia faecicanis]|uniref:Molecular chaperone TorD n=2 Tax=Slackia faecicanis TaxID=255723 RepID=A0A3N0AF33_9ACTN|nr:molecular chaperone TorD [Slackia faecicanis]